MKGVKPENMEITLIELSEADSNGESGEGSDTLHESTAVIEEFEAGRAAVNAINISTHENGTEDSDIDRYFIYVESGTDNEEEGNSSRTPRKKARRGGKGTAVSSCTARSTKSGQDGTKKLATRLIMEFFYVSGCNKSRVHVKKLKAIRVREMTSLNKFVLVRVLKNIIVKIAMSFEPKDYLQLIYDVLQNMGYRSRLKQSLLKCLGSCKFRTMEKSLLRALIIGMFSGEDGHRMITEDVLKGGTVSGDSEGSSSEDSHEDFYSSGSDREGRKFRRTSGALGGRVNKQVLWI